MRTTRYRGPPMTLANMRANGVRSLSIRCELSHHEAVLNVDGYDEGVAVPSFGPRMVCICCGVIGADVRGAGGDRDRLPSAREEGVFPGIPVGLAGFELSQIPPLRYAAIAATGGPEHYGPPRRSGGLSAIIDDHKGQEVAMEQLGMLIGWLGLLSVLVLLGITWMLIQMSKLSEQLDTLVSAQAERRGSHLAN